MKQTPFTKKEKEKQNEMQVRHSYRTFSLESEGLHFSTLGNCINVLKKLYFLRKFDRNRFIEILKSLLLTCPCLIFNNCILINFQELFFEKGADQLGLDLKYIYISKHSRQLLLGWLAQVVLTVSFALHWLTESFQLLKKRTHFQ